MTAKQLVNSAVCIEGHALVHLSTIRSRSVSFYCISSSSIVTATTAVSAFWSLRTGSLDNVCAFFALYSILVQLSNKWNGFMLNRRDHPRRFCFSWCVKFYYITCVCYIPAVIHKACPLFSFRMATQDKNIKCTHLQSLLFATQCPSKVSIRDVLIMFFCPRVRVIWFWVSTDTESRSDTSIIHKKRMKQNEETDPGCSSFFYLIHFILTFNNSVNKQSTFVR